MGISFDATNQQFHLYNDRISYIMKVLRDGHLGQLYFGARCRKTATTGISSTRITTVRPAPMSLITSTDSRASTCARSTRRTVRRISARAR